MCNLYKGTGQEHAILKLKAIGYGGNYTIKIDLICLRYIHRFIIFFASAPRIDRKHILPAIEIDNRAGKRSFPHAISARQIQLMESRRPIAISGTINI